MAESKYQGNSISAADKLLGDFRKNLLGFGSLEAPPWTPEELEARRLRSLANSQNSNPRKSRNQKTDIEKEFDDDDDDDVDGMYVSEDESEEQRRGHIQKNTLKSVKLPFSASKVSRESTTAVSDESIAHLDIGRGSYDGW